MVNCGKPLRDSYTKYRSDIDMARSNFQGIVKSKNIGNPQLSVLILFIKMKAQRLSLMGVQMKKLIHLEMPQYFI